MDAGGVLAIPKQGVGNHSEKSWINHFKDK